MVGLRKFCPGIPSSPPYIPPGSRHAFSILVRFMASHQVFVHLSGIRPCQHTSILCQGIVLPVKPTGVQVTETVCVLRW